MPIPFKSKNNYNLFIIIQKIRFIQQNNRALNYIYKHGLKRT
jgi:hypothetical protein